MLIPINSLKRSSPRLAARAAKHLPTEALMALRFQMLYHWLVGVAVAVSVCLACQANAADQSSLAIALARVPQEQRSAMKWLIEHMPQQDATVVEAEFLLEHCDLAYTAWQRAPWHKSVPEEIFLDALLPYACVSETREAWRTPLHKAAAPIVANATSPAEAAVRLNRKLFQALGVKYSTKRRRADQSPSESIASGLASCTGLSILLVDACRSVGVPARFVGTHLWTNRSGNHSWVEIWDGKGWRFTGAAEQSTDHLDTAWFVGQARTALAGDQQHGIFAVTWQDSPFLFPMSFTGTPSPSRGVDVTERYVATPPQHAKAAEAVSSLDPGPSNRAVTALEQHLDKQGLDGVAAAAFARVPLVKDDAAEAARLLIKAHAAILNKERAAAIEQRWVEAGGVKMPFWYAAYGQKPRGEKSLFISMHGGGGAPKQVNDQQWENQQRLYRPQEGIYLVPRGPSDTWNLWHRDPIDPLFDRLIADMVAIEGVDPDRIYLMGYSAGGDGVYQLAPRMADRFAAAAMMAGHPNETKPDGLRNLPFTIHVGANDAAYRRNTIAADWQEKLSGLAAADPGGYPHLVQIHQGKGHWMDREDATAVPWMANHTRSLRPKKIVWLQDDVLQNRFYWLAVSEPVSRAKTVVSRNGQQIAVDEWTPQGTLKLRLDDSMIDLDKEIVVVTADGDGKREIFRGFAPRTIELLTMTLTERNDPKGVFSAEICLMPTVD